MFERKAFVLLSGGLDSTVCLYKAIRDYAPSPSDTEQKGTFWCEALSVDYGQKHHVERQYAKATCDRLGIKHTILQLGNLLGRSALTSQDKEIPDTSYDKITGVSPMYVPFRNGTMLSAITAYAVNWVNAAYHDHLAEKDLLPEQVRNVAGIYIGAHSEDAHNDAYPDCTPEFLGAMANAIHVGTYHAVRLHAPLTGMQKWEVVKLGKELGVPFENTWSCYRGLDVHCGTCATCRSRRAAFNAAGLPDPTVYKSDPEAPSGERSIAAQ